MAKMIPQKPNAFAPASKEGLIFDVLQNNLSDDYYVFHSFKILSVSKGVLNESETDFVIFHPQKGIICIESKAGQITYKNGEWLYGNGQVIKNGGPYKQAEQKKWNMKNLFEYKKMETQLNNCKLLHAVWFPSIDKSQLLEIELPPEADIRITLTKDSFKNIQQEIDSIFDIKLPKQINTKLNSKDIQKILENILCPTFNLVPSLSSEISINNAIFNQLLKEQTNILNFLEEQPTAIINGIAGTGKTMIAVEKARRHSIQGEKVLFLCFNTALCDYLRKNNTDENIQYYTIAGFACSYCKTQTADYKYLIKLINEDFNYSKFPYKHIIIDEGQDFGQDQIEETELLELLETIAIYNEGSFYVFYDKNQLIQSRRIPKFIQDADCKLTLYKNCRNTKNIATTSMRPMGIIPKLFDGAVTGDSPQIYISNNPQKQKDNIDSILQECKNKGFKNIVILTCKTEDNSIITDFVSNNYYNQNVYFTTCKKFKGLESDVIILIDITEKTFRNNTEKMDFYVGASRAKFKLYMVCNMNENNCINALQEMNKNSDDIIRPYKEFAAKLNASFVKN